MLLYVSNDVTSDSATLCAHCGCAHCGRELLLVQSSCRARCPGGLAGILALCLKGCLQKPMQLSCDASCAGDMAGNGEASRRGPSEEHWYLQLQCGEDQGVSYLP